MTVDSAKRLLAAATIFAGAFVAALALATPASRNFAFVSGGDRLDVFTESGALAATLGAIVAVVATAAIVRVRSAVSIAVFGSVLLTFAALVASPVQLHLRAIAAGLILGGTAALTATNRLLQCSLVAGAVSALVMAGPIVQTPVRYRDYGADEPQIYLLIVLAVFAVLMAVSASVFVASKPVDSRRRVMSVGCLVAIAGLVLHWLFVRTVGSFGSDAAMQNRWLLGLAVIPLVGFAVLAVPIVAQFGWTAYTPLTSVEPSFSPNTWVWTSTSVSVLSVAAAGVAYVVLTRRRGM